MFTANCRRACNKAILNQVQHRAELSVIFLTFSHHSFITAILQIVAPQIAARTLTVPILAIYWLQSADYCCFINSS